MIGAMLTVPECAKQGGVWYHREWLLWRLAGADAQEREAKGNNSPSYSNHVRYTHATTTPGLTSSSASGTFSTTGSSSRRG